MDPWGPSSKKRRKCFQFSGKENLLTDKKCVMISFHKIPIILNEGLRYCGENFVLVGLFRNTFIFFM